MKPKPKLAFKPSAKLKAEYRALLAKYEEHRTKKSSAASR